MNAYFMDCIRENKQPSTNFEDRLKTMELGGRDLSQPDIGPGKGGRHMLKRTVLAIVACLSHGLSWMPILHGMVLGPPMSHSQSVAPL